MHAIQNAAAMFCIACICAEVTALLVGRGWARKCIKATTGLYILVVFFHALPRIKADVARPQNFSKPAVQMQSAEDLLLSSTQERLQTALQQECQQRFGVQTKLEITLRQLDDRVDAERVTMYVPPGSSLADYAEAVRYLHSALGVEPDVEVQEGMP